VFVGSESQRMTPPEASAADLAALVKGNNAFAFDLYQVLKEEEGNLFYSPYSISLLGAIAFAGACAETEEQMAATLHYTLPQDQLHPAFNALDHELARRSEAATIRSGEGFRLEVLNAI
jgi:serpin B